MHIRNFWHPSFALPGVLVAAFGATLALAGCGDDGGDGGEPMTDAGPQFDAGDPDGGPPPTASVRIVHAAVGAGAVDLYLAGTTSDPLQAGFAYQDVLGPVDAPTDLSVDVYPAGADAASTEPIYTFNANGNRIFAGGEGYTVVVRVRDGGGLVAPYFLDSGIPDAASGEVGARFVNATAPTEPFSVDTNGDGSADTAETQAGGSVDAVFSSGQRLLRVFDGSRPVRQLANFLLDDGFLPGAGAVYFIGAGDPTALPESPDGFVFIYIDTESDESQVLLPDVPKARIRVLHASADAPAVDVYPAGATGGTPIIDDLAYGFATGYLNVRTDVAVDIYPGDADPGTSDPILTINEDQLDILDRDEDYTLLAVGDPDPEAPAGEAFRVIPVKDDFTSPGTTSFLARIVHASPQTPTVAIDVTGDAEPETDPIALFDVVDVPLPVAGVRATVFSAGASPTRLTSFTVPGGVLTAGSLVYVVAAGGSGAHPGDPNALVLLASPYAASATTTAPAVELRQDPMIWAFHGVPDVGTPVNLVVLNDAEEDVATVNGVVFGALTGRIQVSPGDYTFEVRLAGDTVAASDATAVTAGTRYLVSAIGLAAPDTDADPADPNNPVEFLVLEDLFDRADGANARVRGVHASPDGAGVEVGTVTDGGSFDVFAAIPEFGTLTYKTSATDAGVVIAPGTVDLGVRDGVTAVGVPTVVFEDVVLEAGDRTFLIAAGEFVPDGAGQALVRLFAIDTAAGPWTVTGYDLRPGVPPPL